MVFTTEGFLEVAIESWPEWDLNPRPLNSVQIYIYIYRYIDRYIFIYIYMCVYVYMYIYVNMYMCIYVEALLTDKY